MILTKDQAACIYRAMNELAGCGAFLEDITIPNRSAGYVSFREDRDSSVIYLKQWVQSEGRFREEVYDSRDHLFLAYEVQT